MSGSIDYVSFPCFAYERKGAALPDILGLRVSLTSLVVAIRDYMKSIRPGVIINMRCPIKASKERLRSWLRLHEHNSGDNEYSEDEDLFQQASPPTDSTPGSSEAIPNTGHQTRRPPASTNSTSASSNSAPTKSQTQATSFSSLASIPAKLKRTLSKRLQRPKQPPTPPFPAPPTLPPTNPPSQTSLIATLDALALSPPELDTLKRMELICHAANAARDRRSPHPQTTPSNTSSTNLNLNLHLRGGGASPSPPPFRRSRTDLLFTPPPPPASDSTRPSGMLWWLAGGRVSQHGRVPTVGELRVRREVEAANRRRVGFWGTVVGWRGVGRVGVLGDGGAGGGERGGGNEGEGGAGDAASVRSNMGSGLNDGGGGEGGDAEAARSKAGSAFGEDGVAAEGEDGGGWNGEGKDGEGDGKGEDGPGAAAKDM